MKLRALSINKVFLTNLHYNAGERTVGLKRRLKKDLKQMSDLLVQ